MGVAAPARPDRIAAFQAWSYRFEFDGRALSMDQRRALRMRLLVDAPSVLPAAELGHGVVWVELAGDRTAKSAQFDIQEMLGMPVKLIRIA